MEMALAPSRKEVRIAASRHIPRLHDPESVAHPRRPGQLGGAPRR